jgi:hypothetical protein
MIINKEEVEKAAENYCNIQNIHPSDITLMVENKVQEYVGDIIIENQGLKLYKDNEENRFKELAVELAEWVIYYERALHLNRFETTEELFEMFKKEKND